MDIKNNKILSKIVDAKKSQVKKKQICMQKFTGKKIMPKKPAKN